MHYTFMKTLGFLKRGLMKNKVIKFHAQDEYTQRVKLKPEPASKFIPNWYKDMPIFSGEKFDLNPAATVTAKRCAPLLDTLTTGYIMPLWSDIFVTQNEYGPYIKWATRNNVADAWPSSQSSTYDIPNGYSDVVFKYLHGWNIETPPGYSCLITHPFGYNNLPIKSITGVVDTDILKTEINVPFIIKENFEGTVEKGTPMFQIIPFKRENWQSEYDTLNDGEHFFNSEKLKTKIINSYSSIRYRKSFK